MTLNINEELSFHASASNSELDFSHEEFTERVGTGFNEHGVRKNRDEDGQLESVDVMFEAMKPGPPENRNGVRITQDFLGKVGGGDYEGTPHIKDHERQDTFSKIGEVRKAWFSDRLDTLMLMTRTPNIEGSQNHQEAIARYTHDPPAITDGSVGFGDNFEAEINDDGEPEMVNGTFIEFSTTNFPGGYDEGGVGVNRAFSEAVDNAIDDEGSSFSVSTETVSFAEHGGAEGATPRPDELERVYSEWESLINMNEEQMERWEKHPCSDKGVDNGESRRDEFMMLMGQPQEEWDQQNVEIANRVIAHIGESMETEPEDPKNGGVGTCPSRWAISLLNRGHNPFDQFPSGNPEFDESEVGESNGSTDIETTTVHINT